MRSTRWTIATTLGFVLGGIGLHSPGASGVGSSYLEADLSAALFGAILGIVVGLVTGGLQLIALGTRSRRIVIATIIAVATAHALADGAPASWSVPIVAVLSGAAAAAALAWATATRDVRAIALWIAAWAGGWIAGVAIAGVFGLSGGSTPDVWAAEHAIIAATLGIVWGIATAPALRRILGSERALSSAG